MAQKVGPTTNEDVFTSFHTFVSDSLEQRNIEAMVEADKDAVDVVPGVFYAACINRVDNPGTDCITGMFNCILDAEKSMGSENNPKFFPNTETALEESALIVRIVIGGAKPTNAKHSAGWVHAAKLEIKELEEAMSKQSNAGGSGKACKGFRSRFNMMRDRVDMLKEGMRRGREEEDSEDEDSAGAGS